MRTRAPALAAGLGLLLAGVALAHAPAPDEAASATLRIAKDEQRRAGIRTQRADTPPPAQRWPARVVADPGASLRVMADQDGVLEPPPGGFATPGAAVAAGAPLAILHPTLAEPQRRDLEAELAQAQRDVDLGRLQIDRYQIDEAESIEVHLLTAAVQILIDYRAAQERLRQLQRALSGTIELRAPRAGRVLRSTARAGRVVQAGEPLFELDGGEAVAVEAVVDDARFALDASALAYGGDGRAIPLRRTASGFDPRTRLRRVLYAADGDATLAVGEPLQLLLRPRAAARFVLPPRSVVGAGGQARVWVHEGAERFVAVPVHVLPQADGNYAVEQGLAAQQRVVVEGAAFLQRRAGQG